MTSKPLRWRRPHPNLSGLLGRIQDVIQDFAPQTGSPVLLAWRTPSPVCRGRARSARFWPDRGDQSVLSTGAFAPCIAVDASVDQGLRAFSPLRTTCAALTRPGWL